MRTDKVFQESNDATQIFTIQQYRSWSTLNLSKEMLERFIETYNISPNFWKCVFVFERKSEENELEFPGFNHRKRRAELGSSVCDYGDHTQFLDIKPTDLE